MLVGTRPIPTWQIPTCRFGTRRPQRQGRRPTRQILRWWRSPTLGLPGRRQALAPRLSRGRVAKAACDRRLSGSRPERRSRGARGRQENPGRGGDPMAVKKQAKAEQAIASANTFETIAAELVEKKRDEDKADQTISKTEWLLSLAYPEIGSRPIKEITAPDILRVLRGVAARGRSSRRSACARPSGRSSATPSRPGAPTPIRPALLRALSPRRR